VEELRGAKTQGRTLDEARDNLQDAVRLVIEANREISLRDTADRTVIREELLLSA
jgi:predicted RNase H-like HicB family nuclease